MRDEKTVRAPKFNPEAKNIFIEVWRLLDEILGTSEHMFQYYLKHTQINPEAPRVSEEKETSTEETVLEEKEKLKEKPCAKRAQHIKASYSTAMRERIGRISSQLTNMESPPTDGDLAVVKHQLLIGLVKAELEKYTVAYDEIRKTLVRACDSDDECSEVHKDVSSIVSKASPKAAIDHAYQAVSLYNDILNHSSSNRSPRDISHLSKQLAAYAKKQASLHECIELQKKMTQAKKELMFLDLAFAKNYKVCEELALTDAELFTLKYHPTLSLSNRTGMGAFANHIYDGYKAPVEGLDVSQRLYGFMEFLAGFYAQCRRYYDACDEESRELAMMPVKQNLDLIDEQIATCERCLTDASDKLLLQRLQAELHKLQALLMKPTKKALLAFASGRLAKSCPGASSSSSAPSSPESKFISLFRRNNPNTSRALDALSVSPRKAPLKEACSSSDEGDSKRPSPPSSWESHFSPLFGRRPNSRRSTDALISPRKRVLSAASFGNDDSSADNKPLPEIPRLII